MVAGKAFAQCLGIEDCADLCDTSVRAIEIALARGRSWFGIARAILSCDSLDHIELRSHALRAAWNAVCMRAPADAREVDADACAIVREAIAFLERNGNRYDVVELIVHLAKTSSHAGAVILHALSNRPAWLFESVLQSDYLMKLRSNNARAAFAPEVVGPEAWGDLLIDACISGRKKTVRVILKMFAPGIMTRSSSSVSLATLAARALPRIRSDPVRANADDYQLLATTRCIVCVNRALKRFRRHQRREEMRRSDHQFAGAIEVFNTA